MAAPLATIMAKPSQERSETLDHEENLHTPNHVRQMGMR